MNRFKEVKPIVFLTCLMLGIALLSIYSFASEFITIDIDSADKIGNLSKIIRNNGTAALKTTGYTARDISGTGQGSESRSEIDPEERRALSVKGDDSLYTASRGKIDRSSGNMQAIQEENQQDTAAATKMEEPAEPKPNVSAEPKQTAPVAAKQEVSAAAKPAAPAPAEPAATPKAAPAADSGYAYELDLLARLITAEAQSEPYEAKVAVGAVVLNRVQSGQWADTIKGVIYQNINGYYQFTPVQNGWINKPAEPESVKAAKAALNGSDPTNGAQFYYDDKATNTWILSKQVSVQFGHMIFAY